MNLKHIFLFCIFFVLNSSLIFSQQKKNVPVESDDLELESDTTLSIPAEFDNTLDNLLRSWIIQQRSDSSNCISSELPAVVSDSVYKLRLSQMPCLMEMPYNSFVRSFIELYTVRKRTQVEYMLGMSTYYFPIFEEILEANGLPLELKYLPIIESALNTTAVSHMGAAGLWQFMIATGRMYGLEINSLIDERLNPIKATKAAAHFLKDLYSIYGDWNLVIASYNCGPGNVNKAIRRAGGKRDFWEIYPYLPKETRGYVPIFIAANYSLHFAAEHNLCPATVNMPVIADTVMINQRLHLQQVSDVLNIPIEQVRLLNPQYRKDIVPGNIKPYSLRLPLSYANNYIDKEEDILNYKADELVNNRRAEIEIARVSVPSSSSSKVTYHTVRSGQNLSVIASRYGVSVTKLKSWNHLKSSKIKVGQRLKIIK